MYESVQEVIRGAEFTVVEHFSLEPRPPAFRSIPPFLFETAIGEYLSRTVGSAGGLWLRAVSSSAQRRAPRFR